MEFGVIFVDVWFYEFIEGDEFVYVFDDGVGFEVVEVEVVGELCFVEVCVYVVVGIEKFEKIEVE